MHDTRNIEIKEIFRRWRLEEITKPEWYFGTIAAPCSPVPNGHNQLSWMSTMQPCAVPPALRTASSRPQGRPRGTRTRQWARSQHMACGPRPASQQRHGSTLRRRHGTRSAGAGLVLIQGYSTEYPKKFATKFIYIVYITCICIKIENKGISKRILKF